jgi:small subunit ribosomal protein S2
MAQIGIKELLEAGVHFGHQTRRWNPKMRRFIHGENGGIYVIDLLKTERLLREAQEFASAVAHRGGTVLFVGTKKQARDAVKDAAEKSGMPYVNHRWLGGLLTNFQTINQRIARLHDLERYETDGQLALLPTRERMAAEADLAKLRANLGGVKNMTRTPNAMVVIDLKVEEIAVREAQRLRIPIIGLVDTNCDPDGIDFVVPGNDDAIRSCALITHAIGDVVGEGQAVFRAQAEQARKEAEEQQRREAEERQRREAEEQAAREAAEREAAEAARAVAEAESVAKAAPPVQEASAEAAAAEAPPAAPPEAAVADASAAAPPAEAAKPARRRRKPAAKPAEGAAAADVAPEPAGSPLPAEPAAAEQPAAAAPEPAAAEQPAAAAPEPAAEVPAEPPAEPAAAAAPAAPDTEPETRTEEAGQ